MDSTPDFGKLLEIAMLAYNAANPSSPITKDTASRAIVLGLETLIATNVANASTVLNPI